MTTISVTTEDRDGIYRRLFGLPSKADRMARDFVEDGARHGATFMRFIVPEDSGALRAAVEEFGPTVIGTGHYRGGVGVDQSIAPHASMVDDGTGVQGPFGQPVTVLRPSRTGKPGRGTMRFTKQGEPARYRQQVKATPSTKIAAGKDFSGRTFDEMRDWSRIRVSVITARLFVDSIVD